MQGGAEKTSSTAGGKGFLFIRKKAGHGPGEANTPTGKGGRKIVTGGLGGRGRDTAQGPPKRVRKLKVLN